MSIKNVEHKRFLILVKPKYAMRFSVLKLFVIAGTIAPIKSQFALSSIMRDVCKFGPVGCMVGVVLAGSSSDRFGRKKVLLASGVLLAIASVGCAVALDTVWLVVFRIAGGAGVGLASIVSPLYISEVAPPHLRGRLVSVFQLTITIGILAAMLMNGWLLSYSLPNVTCSGRIWYWIRRNWRCFCCSIPLSCCSVCHCCTGSPGGLVTAGERLRKGRWRLFADARKQYRAPNAGDESTAQSPPCVRLKPA